MKIQDSTKKNLPNRNFCTITKAKLPKLQKSFQLPFSSLCSVRKQLSKYWMGDSKVCDAMYFSILCCSSELTTVKVPAGTIKRHCFCTLLVRNIPPPG